jgi:NADPH:quinone reductase-like Zn-dependent oxidoreductase
MEASPVNPVDYLFANGWYPIRPELPDSFIGSEGVGRVLAVGSAVDPSLHGKRVIVLGNYQQGVWAHNVIAPATSVVPVREGVDALQLSMLSINPVTAYVMLNRYVELKPGDWVGQNLGNSAVARSVIALARKAGVKTLSVVRSEKAAAEVRAAGGDIALVDGDDLADQIVAALGGERLRMIFDGIAGDAPGRLVSGLERGGTVVTYSSQTGASPVLPFADHIWGGAALHGLWILNWIRSVSRAEFEEVLAELADLVASGALHVPVDSTFPLERYQEALARHTSPERSGKVFLTFDALTA